LQDVAGITITRVLNEVTTFANMFRALLSSTDMELNEFVKNTHASNSAKNCTTKDFDFCWSSYFITIDFI
jgi:hypothetical protein